MKLMFPSTPAVFEWLSTGRDHRVKTPVGPWIESLREVQIERQKVVGLKSIGAQLPEQGGDLPAVVSLMIDEVEEEAPAEVSIHLAPEIRVGERF